MYSSNFVFSKLPQTNAGRGHRFLNPKQTILFLVFLPLFVPAPPTHPLIHFIVPSALFATMTIAVFAGDLSKLTGLGKAPCTDRPLRPENR